MTDFGFDGAAASEIGDQFWRQAAPCAADQHAGLQDAVASITTVDDGKVGALVGQDLDLLDAPGVLPPRLDDQQAALRLALCDDIGQAAYDTEAAALAFVQLLVLLEGVAQSGVPVGLLEKRYGVALGSLPGGGPDRESWLLA